MEEKKDFDFSELWNDEEDSGGLVKYVPVANFVLLIIILILSVIK